jgi:hypothetical protein
VLGFPTLPANLLSIDMADTMGYYTHYPTNFQVVQSDKRDAYLILCTDR